MIIKIVLLSYFSFLVGAISGIIITKTIQLKSKNTKKQRLKGKINNASREQNLSR